VTTARQGSVLVITIDRPEVRNAVNHAVALGIAAALDELDADPDLVAGVLTGSPPGFCAGMDLKAFVAGESVSAGDRGFAGIVRRASRKPLVAAVEGFAFAGGLELALACDLLVVARDTLLGVPEVKRSLVPTGGALRWLPQRLPYGVAMEMALTGEPLDTRRAYDLGLINRLTEPGAALAEAISLTELIAANGPLAVTATKEVLKRQFEWGEQEFWDRQDELTDHVFASRDAQEGAVAFTEKRQPVWEGR
jgi:enoyl-CoA hydratase